jgi:MFS family permease
MNSIALNNRKLSRIAVSIFFFIAGFTFASWASRIPEIKIKLGLNEAALGTILFALPIGQMVSVPLSGWLISRFGSKKMLSITGILYPLSILPLALASTSWELMAGLFFFGLLANIINISMNTQAIGVELVYGRSIMASFHGLWSIAGFAGAAIGSLFVQLGLSPLLHFIIVFCAMTLFSILFQKNILQTDNRSQDKRSFIGKPDKKIWILGLIAFCSMMCEGAIADWSGVYLQKVIESPVSLAALAYVAFAASMAIGRLFGDRLIVRFGVKQMLGIGAILMLTGIMSIVLAPHVISALVGFLLVGLGASCIVPIVFALAGKSKDISSGIALTTVSSIGFLGLLFGPPVLGYLAQAAGLRWSFLLLAAMAGAIYGLSKMIPNDDIVEHPPIFRKLGRLLLLKKYPEEVF